LFDSFGCPGSRHDSKPTKEEREACLTGRRDAVRGNHGSSSGERGVPRRTGSSGNGQADQQEQEVEDEGRDVLETAKFLRGEHPARTNGYRKALRFRVVETPIALRYPNERVHETVLNRDLRVGERFDMYGRTWTAVQTKHRGRRQDNGVRRILCVPAE